MTTPRPTMLTTAEVARQLRVAPYTVRVWCASGVLPAYTIGKQHRIDPADLERFLQQRRVAS